MNNKFLGLIWGVLGLFLCNSSAWADVGSSGAAPSGKRFAFRIRGEVRTLDWNKAYTQGEGNLLTNLMEGLVAVNSQNEVEPALASSWDISLDRKVYTFKLRRDVKWSDGVPLKAQDFVFSWKRLLSPMTAAPYAYFLFDVEGAEDYNKGKLQDSSQLGIKALDDWTLEVRLKQPVAHWIFLPAFWVTFPLRQDVIEKYGNAWETPGRMVVLGPYFIESHDVDSKWVLRANRSYYGIRGNVDEITAWIVKEDPQALSLYEAGQIDFLADLSTKDTKNLRSRPELKAFPQLKTVYLGFSTDKYPVSNVHFRRAIAMAINKNRIREVLFSDFQPASSFVPPGMLGHSTSQGLPFDVIQAKQELKASGVDLSPGFALDYIYPDWDKSEAVAQWIQSDLKENLKLDLKLQKFENKAFRSQLDMQASSLFEASWTADYPDPDTFVSLFLGTSGNSHISWKNPQFDESVQKARQTRARVEREQLYFQLQNVLLNDEAVLVPLYYEPNLALIKPRVKTIELNSLGYLYLRRLNVGT